MKDLYLSYTHQTLRLAEYLKQDIESNTNLLVALENDDWEEEGDEFSEHLDSAKHVLVLLTPAGNITVWIMDPNITEIQPAGFQRARDFSLPPQISFTTYAKGLEVFLYILKVVTGSGDVEVDPEHEKIAIKEERTVSNTRVSSGRRESPRRNTIKAERGTTSSSKRRRESPTAGFISPVKKFQRMMRKLSSKSNVGPLPISPEQ